MSAFTGLCSLCHFDLDLIGAYQISAGYTETSAGYLFDSRASVLPIRPYRKSLQILTTFTGIGTSVNGVHCNCQCLMCFLGNGTIAHGSCLKSGYNGIHTFYFLDRDSFFRIIEIHQATQVLY